MSYLAHDLDVIPEASASLLVDKPVDFTENFALYISRVTKFAPRLREAAVEGRERVSCFSAGFVRHPGEHLTGVKQVYVSEDHTRFQRADGLPRTDDYQAAARL